MTRQKKKRVEALILDIDGTLIDSNDIHAQAWQEAFARFGREIPFEVMRAQIGKGGDLLVPDLLNAREIRQFGRELEKYRKTLFQNRYMRTISPFPGMKQALETLRSRDIELALASSADRDEVDFYIELLGIGDLLEGATSTSDAEHSKPSPEIFEAALKKLGSPEGATLVVGDTPYDILASHRAALPIAAVLSGGFSRTLLEKAEFLYDTVPQLVNKIEEVDDYFGE